ncbi:hypothetical protein RvY_12830 [Ramazzottius varieornatus]|uniref:Uncharacterized protein n=1 Tax=Ramazzottius varieornatus TaxID=947166 RepID=A0A1D1VUI1_RAMVA|nr:hypothetical protein RvY_12830 [Ramazzottius varieornatus]
MLQQCRNDEDICRVTAVTLPIAGIAQSTVVPTINRGCFRSSDLNTGIGLYSPPLGARSSSCQSYTENQRISRTCRCNFDNCNSWSATQLQNNDVSGNTGSGYQGGYYNSGSTVGANVVMGLSTAFLMALSRIYV